MEAIKKILNGFLLGLGLALGVYLVIYVVETLHLPESNEDEYLTGRLDSPEDIKAEIVWFNKDSKEQLTLRIKITNESNKIIINPTAMVFFTLKGKLVNACALTYFFAMEPKSSAAEETTCRMDPTAYSLLEKKVLVTEVKYKIK
jgi:hypothetical protein